MSEDLFYKGLSASLPRLHTCENKVPFWDKSKFFASHEEKELPVSMNFVAITIQRLKERTKESNVTQ